MSRFEGVRPIASAPSAVDPRWSFGVVVPAHDEVHHVGSCVASIRASLAPLQARGVRTWIVVVADACRDETALVARALVGLQGEVIEVEARNVGRVRAIGTDALLRHLCPGRPDRTWIATTDADSTVPTSWADDHLRLAEAGAAGVAGVVRVDSFAGHAPEVGPRHVAGYVTHEDGSHPHVHGANLGVRADAYRAVGGWPELTTAEDHALWRRLADGGWPTVSSITAWVTTSGRPVGRAPSGFAGHLTALAPAASSPVRHLSAVLTP
ncbi:glycosyltransferase family 2 protein [soil metagenome]